MRVQLPSIDQGQFVNNIASRYSLNQFLTGLSSAKKQEFEEFHKKLTDLFPLTPPKSEDAIVEKLLALFRAGGWAVKDTRSTFIPKTELKPDITLDNRVAFVEALKLVLSGGNREWTEHCTRTIAYSRHSDSQIAICTDGRRWFLVSTEEGEPVCAFLDTKRYPSSGEELKHLAVMLWRSGPLFSKLSRSKMKEATEISKTLFKNHILKTVKSLDDRYKEVFGLVSAGAFAHYSSSRLFNTDSLIEATYALTHEHNDVACELMRKFFQMLSTKDFPGISSVASRALKLVGLDEKKDLRIYKAILVDSEDYPLSWELFNSDDLSQVYEALSANSRKENGIYTTPRDLCFEVVKDQLERYGDLKLKNYALVDPCCGSGSFIDQAVKAIGTKALPPEGRKVSRPKSLTFLGQDVQELGVAISIVNVYVACIRHLWHLTDVTIEIKITTGDTRSTSSPLYKNWKKHSPDYTFVFGNPPFLKSRSSNSSGKVTEGNLLFEISERAMSMCQPGEMGFVLPGHVKGSDTAESFDKKAKQLGMRLYSLWHLTGMKLFKGVSEKRHIVAFWGNDTRAKGKLLVFTPPKNAEVIGVSRAIQQAKTNKSLQFTSEITTLSDAPLYAGMYIPKATKAALEEVSTLESFKVAGLLTVVQGIQESHPAVPSPDNKRFKKIIEREGYAEGDPIFVLPPAAQKEMLRMVKSQLTPLEKAHLRLHAKSSPSVPRFDYPRSTNKVIFTNGKFGKFSDDRFSNECPHFCAWLKPYYSLLMADIDRAADQLKWFELQRSRDPRPTAKLRPGIDFALPKVIVSQFLNGPFWAWHDQNEHVVAGSAFNVISEFPGEEDSQLRSNWNVLLGAWLNSYLIREVWLKLLGNCKVRGIDGEVQIGKHLLNIPVPAFLLVGTQNKTQEMLVRRLAKVAMTPEKKISGKTLLNLDVICWQILEESVGRKLGKPTTREFGNINLDAKAS